MPLHTIRIVAEFQTTLTPEEVRVRLEFVRQFVAGLTVTVEDSEPNPDAGSSGAAVP